MIRRIEHRTQATGNTAMTATDLRKPLDAEACHDHRRFAWLAYGAILLVFGGFGAWASIAPLDSAAIAPARVAVEGDRKPVQHLEGGIVRDILVRDAEQVAEGQTLFRLDPTAARANAELLGRQVDAALAQEARIMAERAGLATIVFPPQLVARAVRADLAQAMTEQQRLLLERRRSIANQAGIFEARIEQTGKDMEGRARRLDALRSQLSSLTAEIASVRPIVEKGFFARNKFRALEREASRIEGEIGGVEGDIARLVQVVEESRLQIRQLRQRAEEEQTQSLTETRGRLADLREKLAVAEEVLARIEIRAPRAGIVLNVRVSAIGAVVAPGATLAEVVPPLERLTLTARVSPLNIQSIAAGQKAEVRFPAFSSRKAEPIFGRVETVSADAVTDPATRETYYQSKIVVDSADLPADVAAKIVPGMPADVLIITGERTLLAYLLGPLRDTLARAMRDH